ncbi:MAG: RNA polymerase sigma factor [Bacteroidia bacterium]|nr:RNA polymerase sigma factor [Bacteroidia bacterium]
MVKNNFDQEQVIKGCIDNDRKSQELLYRRFFEPMVRMCRKHLQDDHRAIEVLNDGMLRVFQKISQFENKGSLEGWIRRIIYHAICNHYNSRSNYVKFLILEDHDAPIAGEADEQSQLDDLLNMIERLPKATSRVFKLHAIEGFKHAEIAKMLGISVGTSKWHLSQARMQMKTMIQQSEKMSDYGA